MTLYIYPGASVFSPISTKTISLIAVLLSAGCSGKDLFGPGEDESLPESHPQAVGPAASVQARPVWSENGHLAYVLPDYSTAISRVDGTGAVRVLHTVTAPARISAVALSPDASQWFTVTSDAGKSVLRWHRDGASEVLTERGSSGEADARKGYGVIVAPNGDFAYVVRPDSLFLKRGGAAPSVIATGCRSIAAISPTGDGVICYTSDPFANAARFSTDGSVTQVPTSEGGGAYITDIRWTASGTQLLYSVLLSHFVFERVSDPQSKFSTPSVGYPEWPDDAVLAADGRSFVYANYYCAKPVDLFGCDKAQLILHHADMVTRTSKRVGVHTFRDGSELSISRDGRRIAYALDSQLFVLPID